MADLGLDRAPHAGSVRERLTLRLERFEADVRSSERQRITARLLEVA